MVRFFVVRVVPALLMDKIHLPVGIERTNTGRCTTYQLATGAKRIVPVHWCFRTRQND